MAFNYKILAPFRVTLSGADLGFQVRGAHLKKLRQPEGGAKIVGVFRVKNHDFTPKNHIFFSIRFPPPPGSAPGFYFYKNNQHPVLQYVLYTKYNYLRN